MSRGILKGWFCVFSPALATVMVLVLAAPMRGAPLPDDPLSEKAAVEPGKTQDNQRILEVIPNYKTVEDPSKPIEPMTPRQKFKLGAMDSFDPHALPSIAVYAGIAQWQNQYKSFGQGMAGFGKRYAGAYADQAIGNMIGEAVVPTLLHLDPRYFRMANGGFLWRSEYAVSRVVVTRTDSGGRQFNYPEFVGNGLQAAISNAYYPAEDRSLSQTMHKIGFQTLVDAGFNIVKEYWPDIRHKVLHK